MARKKSDETELGRLLSSCRDDYKRLQPYRENFVGIVERMAGTNWTDNASLKDQPCNKLQLTSQILCRNLVPKNPRMMMSTFARSARPDVKKLESWVNNKIEDVDLANTLRQARVHAFVSIGIIKVALGAPVDAARFSWKMNAGEPFAELVPLENWVYDTRAAEFAQAYYMGHSYMCPLEVVKDDKRNYSKARKDLVATPQQFTNTGGDERLQTLFFDDLAVNRDGPQDVVKLWEIWVPQQKLIYTFSDDQMSGACANHSDNYDYIEPLRVQRWIGPEHGPYHILGDITVPGSAMPKGYLVDLVPLHDAEQDVMRKLIRQTQRFKSILTSQGGNEEDVTRIKNENDGGVCRTTGANPKETVYGGPHPLLMNAAMLFDDRISMQAGNLKAMGGLEAQAGTLGQERLLAESSSRAIADLQGNTISFVSSVVKALCWYWWHDPFKVMRVKMPVSQGSGLEITRTLTPEKRLQTSWDDLQIRIDPYTLQHQTPSSKLQFIVQTLTQVTLPMMPLLQKQGIGIDANKIIEIISKLGDCPEMQEIFTVAEAPQDQAQENTGAEEQSIRPAQTEHTTTRRSISEGTSAGNRRFLQNALMGVNSGGNQETGEA